MATELHVVHSGEVHSALNCCAGLALLDFASDRSILTVVYGATVTLEGCTISRNTITGRQGDGAIVNVNVGHPDSLYPSQTNTILRMQQCFMSGNDAPHDILGNTVVTSKGIEVSVYSDTQRPVHSNDSAPAHDTTFPLSQAPSTYPGINASSPWFENIRQVRSQMLACYRHIMASIVFCVNN